MSILEEVKAEVMQISRIIARDFGDLRSHVNEINKIKRDLEILVRSSMDGSNRRIMAILADATNKTVTAQNMLYEASKKLENWANGSGSSTAGNFTHGPAKDERGPSFKETEDFVNETKSFDDILNANKGSGNYDDLGATTRIETWESTDPLVGDLANSIDDAMPGKVIDVNKVVKNTDGRIVTDFDIELDNAVIQVKSGGGKGLTTQLKNTSSVTTKEVVAYVPDAKPSIIKSVLENDYKIFTDIEDLINYLKGK